VKQRARAVSLLASASSNAVLLLLLRHASSSCTRQFAAIADDGRSELEPQEQHQATRTTTNKSRGE